MGVFNDFGETACADKIVMSKLMKLFSLFVLVIESTFVWAQQPLSACDTTQDWNERFYKNGQLALNGYYVYLDSSGYYDWTMFDFDPLIDSTKMERVQHRKWIEYFDKKWQPTDSSNQYYYCLCEFSGGYAKGKVYYFKKNGKLIQSALRYPNYSDEEFNGVRRIYYTKKDVIESIYYNRFTEDSLKGFYYNSSFYYTNGQLASYSLNDEFNNRYESLKYNKKGLCTYELKLNNVDHYTIKRRKRGRKVIEVREDKGIRTKTKMDTDTIDD